MIFMFSKHFYGYPFLLGGDMKLIDRIKIQESELKKFMTVRTCNLLAGIDVFSLEQLANCDDVELMKIPTFGKKNLQECLDVLRDQYVE